MFRTDGAFPLSLSAALALAASATLHFTPVAWRERFMSSVSKAPSWQFAGASVAVIYMVVVFTRGQAGFIYYQF